MNKKIVIMQLYLRLLSKRYKHIDQEALLAYAGISRDWLLTDNSEITSAMLYRFFRRAVDLTENTYLAREAGRYFMSIDVKGFTKHYMLSMLPPRLIFMKLNCIVDDITLPSQYDVKWLSGNSVDLKITPLSTEEDNQFYCSQRKAIVEAIVESFSGEPAKVVTKKCTCKGDDYCRYIITWKESRQITWKKRWITGLIALPLANLISAFFFTDFVIHYSLPTSAIILLLLSLMSERIGKAHLQESMAAITDICDREKENSLVNRNNNEIIEAIGRTISLTSELNTEETIAQILETLNHRLNFDRGFVLLRTMAFSNEYKYAGSFDIHGDLLLFLENSYLDLDDEKNARSIFADIAQKLEPFWSSGLQKIGDEITKNDPFLSVLKGRTFICCPIVNNSVCHGFLYVDLLLSDRILTHSDVNLIRGITSFIGISISSALNMEILNQQIEQITARDKLLNEQKESLKEEIDKKTAILRKAVALANEQTEAKTRFLANMSHEIRTPLHGIIGNSEILADEIVDEDKKKRARTITRSAKSLIQIIDDILDVSKVEAGQLRVSLKPFCIADVIAHVMELCEASAHSKNIALKLNLDPECPNTVVGDSTRLRQVLLNLVGNAVKFTSTGGVTLNIKVDAVQSQCTAIKFTVTDTGIGMTSDQSSEIFDCFAQGSEEITLKYGGTGLGVTISKQLVELMGGALSVTSVYGTGSSFMFVLPFKQCPQQYVTANQSLPCDLDHSATNKRILLADDTETNREVTAYHLRKVGYAVDITEDGAETVNKVLQNEYDVVLMDIQMPNKDGYEATREIRAAGYNLLPILAMTASTNPETLPLCLQSGMNHVIRKPITKVELLNEINVWSETAKVPTCSDSRNVQEWEELVSEFEENYECIEQATISFTREVQSRLPELYAAVAEGDFELLSKRSHAMAGASGILCIKELSCLFKQIEEQANFKNIAEVKKLLQAAQMEFNKFIVFKYNQKNEIKVA